jgi:hypothetical protein
MCAAPVEQERLRFRKTGAHPWFFCAVPVAQSLGFCVVFVVFVVLILLAIVLLDLRFTSSDYNFGVFKLFLFEID